MRALTKTNNQLLNGTYLSKILKYKFLYFMLMPATILVIVFQYAPMGGIIMAFQKFDVLEGFSNSPFVGLDNFAIIFSNPKFLAAIKNTLVYSSVCLFVGFPFPIILAILFNELNGVVFKRVVQTISYMPYFLSWIAVISLFYSFFAEYGQFNEFRAWIFGGNISRSNILMDPDNFLGIIFWSGMWKGLGWSSVIYLAAITGIDVQQYEAAVIDGCKRLKQIIYITLPGIAPTALIILILNIGSLVSSNFEQVYGFQNIFTQEKTEVINTMVYRLGLREGNYSMATAFGLAQGLVQFVLVFTANKIVKRVSGMGIW